MKRIAIFIFMLISLNAFSQVSKRVTYNLEELFPQFSYGTGQIMITSDERLPSIIKNYVNYLSSHPIRGWRVQIYFGSGHKARNQAEKIRRKFQSLYPDIPTYIIFEQPYFKVRVGNFASRRDAAKFLFLLKEQFPKAFLTEDNIDVHRLTD
jgi:hypothetical protein